MLRRLRWMTLGFLMGICARRWMLAKARMTLGQVDLVSVATRVARALQALAQDPGIPAAELDAARLTKTTEPQELERRMLFGGRFYRPPAQVGLPARWTRTS